MEHSCESKKAKLGKQDSGISAEVRRNTARLGRVLDSWGASLDIRGEDLDLVCAGL